MDIAVKRLISINVDLFVELPKIIIIGEMTKCQHRFPGIQLHHLQTIMVQYSGFA